MNNNVGSFKILKYFKIRKTSIRLHVWVELEKIPHWKFSKEFIYLEITVVFPLQELAACGTHHSRYVSLSFSSWELISQEVINNVAKIRQMLLNFLKWTHFHKKIKRIEKRAHSFFFKCNFAICMKHKTPQS